MILIRADANSSIGMGHVMRCLSLADAIAGNSSYPTIIRGKQNIKFVLADQTAADLVKSRSYEPIILKTKYDHMDEEIYKWSELVDSMDVDLIIVDSYFVTMSYLIWLKNNIGFVVYIDDVLTFPYPVDVLIDYNVFASQQSYNELYKGYEKPKFILGPTYVPLRRMFQGISSHEQKEEVKNVLLSTGGSDELHIAINFLRTISLDGKIYHILIGAMNQDKEEIRTLLGDNENIILHENVADMRSLISSMDVIISAAGSTLYEICACGVPLITFSIADNQVPGAEAFERFGLAMNIGDLREPTSIDHNEVMSGFLSPSAMKRIIRGVDLLASDKDKRVNMSIAQQLLIDGRGAERLAEKILNTIR